MDLVSLGLLDAGGSLVQLPGQRRLLRLRLGRLLVAERLLIRLLSRLLRELRDHILDKPTHLEAFFSGIHDRNDFCELRRRHLTRIKRYQILVQIKMLQQQLGRASGEPDGHFAMVATTNCLTRLKRRGESGMACYSKKRAP